MGDLVQFVPRSTSKTLLEVHEDKAAEFLAAAPALSLPSERARRMISEARAQYQAIFPDEIRSVDLALGLAVFRDGKRVEIDDFLDTAPCECNPSPENLA